MGVRKYKPTSPGRRGMSSSDFANVTTDKPLKKLTRSKKRISGRNTYGRITVRRRGGGHKRRYRIIDFRRDKFVPARVETLEYDPNRSARIALLVMRMVSVAISLRRKGCRSETTFFQDVEPTSKQATVCRFEIFLWEP